MCSTTDLTPREREVVVLMASGLSNRDGLGCGEGFLVAAPQAGEFAAVGEYVVGDVGVEVLCFV